MTVARNGRACLLAVVAAAAAGCASSHFRASPELPVKKSAIVNAGILQPDIALYEEQFRNRLVPHGEWSREASTAVRKAFVEEMTAGGLSVAAIDGEDRELNEMADLFGAVDFSIVRHVHGDKFNEIFPAKRGSFDYSLGPAPEAMARHRVDAVWFVAGINLLPTAGTQIADAVDVLMQIAGGLGRAPVGTSIMEKLKFRAALVDGGGTVLFHCELTPSAVRTDDEPLRDDLRDPAVARRYARAVLAEYRKATAR